MPNAAPFIAHPARRIAAGIVDLVVVGLLMTPALFLAGHLQLRSEGVELVLSVYGLYHFVCYSWFQGGTVGLRLFDMQVVGARSGQPLSAWHALARAAFRPALIYAVGWIAFSTPLLFPMIMPVLIAPLFVELAMMFISPARQTLSDFVTGTLVINLPPPQPHRAPAGPMYSPTDAEFGLRPKRIKRES